MFIVRLKSSSFNGQFCFIRSVQDDHGNYRWTRVVEPEFAFAFSERAAAQGAIEEMMRAVRYQSPESNGNLVERLSKAEIIHVQE